MNEIRRQKMAAPYRVFDGREYKAIEYYHTKAEAARRARRIREEGLLARVISDVPWEYVIYTRKKRK